MKKVKDILGCIIPLLYALLIQIVVSAVVIILYSSVKVFQLIVNGSTNYSILTDLLLGSLSNEVLISISAIAALVALILFGYWYYKQNQHKNKKDFKEIVNYKTISLLAVMGVALQIVVSVILNLLFMLKPEWFESYGELMDQLNVENSLISIFYIVIIAPLSEEVIFRGVIFHKAKKVMPILWANVLQALLFGIYHMNLIQGIYAFIIGMVFGFVYISYNSLLSSILLHASINLSGVLLGYITLEDKGGTWLIVATAFILSMIGIGVISNVLKKKYKENCISGIRTYSDIQ